MAEDSHPSADKLVTVSDGYLLHNVSGIRARVVSRLDGKGYDVTKRMSLAMDRFKDSPLYSRTFQRQDWTDCLHK